MKILYILQVFLINYSNQDIAESLKHVLNSYKHVSDPKCVFNYTEVNSRTIKHFPKCDEVFGILVINENTDLEVSQLKKAFSKMTVLYGGIRVEYSKFENLNFLTVDQDGWFYMYCETYGVYIWNNQNLTDVYGLWDVYLAEDGDGRECDFRMENNPKLNAENFCTYGSMYMFMDLKVKGNMKDCGCQGDELTQSSFPNYNNCTKLFSGFHLDNQTMVNNLDALSNLDTIRGGIDIHNAGVTNLSFFGNLQIIEVNNEMDHEKLILNIAGNALLEKLAIPYLRELSNSKDGVKLARIERNHPDFCLTIEEIAFFLENHVFFVSLEMKLCEDTRTRISNINVCRYRSMKSLEENCNLIIGDIIINSRDEEYIHKLSNVLYLFGSLAIQNTTLDRLDSLYNLRYILHLNNPNPIFQIVGNKKLKEARLVDVENVITNGNRTAIFQGNHPDLFQDGGGDCRLFDGMDNDETNYRLRLDFIGGDCGEEVMIVHRSSWRIQILVIFTFVISRML
ncbi:Protein CBG10378 [Caenorhabditis briggsae]|uniref:Protein CBG10378 n=1 Tax=Caenorhabditis briggsae TaxID=6238 RepID=E3CU17_CAEBR|nr:Protein CBG10378 [Caenorhabditis briggsae]CBX33052.1 Protein CBG10378 [Caenorhabditis briggsae]